MLQAYGEYWERYADFKGKTDRRTFWLSILAGILAAVVVSAISSLLIPRGKGVSPTILLRLFTVATIIPTAALIVRRLRDAGYAWGWIFLYFLAGIGWIVLAVMCAKESGAGQAKYDPAQFPGNPQNPSRPVNRYNPAPPLPQQSANAVRSAPYVPAPAVTAVNAAPGKSGTFYVFAAQGVAFGNPSGDMVQEKAETLANGYAPAKDMKLVIVRPDSWGGRVQSSSGGGVITSSINFADFKDAMRSWLRRNGVPDDAAEEGLRVSDSERLMLTNPFSGVTVIGVPVPEKKAVQAEAKPDYKKLADKLAHHESLMFEDPEQKELEEQLLAGGEEAQKAIADYLALCSTGFMTYGWWSRAAVLVGLIRKIGGPNTEQRLKMLTQKQTRIWEYHTQVIEVAEKELLALQKEKGDFAGGLVPPEFAHATLLELQNVYPPEKRLAEFYKLMPSSAAWNSKEQAFYYFIAGGAARVLYPYNNANLAFYAAQVFNSPDPNSMGWQHLREKEGSALQATADEARRMHEKYPVPATMEEAAAYPM